MGPLTSLETMAFRRRHGHTSATESRKLSRKAFRARESHVTPIYFCGHEAQSD